MIIHAKAAVADQKGSFTLEEIEVHPPQAGEVRVALKASGICHTDYDSLNWGYPVLLNLLPSGLKGVAYAALTMTALCSSIMVSSWWDRSGFIRPRILAPPAAPTTASLSSALDKRLGDLAGRGRWQQSFSVEFLHVVPRVEDELEGISEDDDLRRCRIDKTRPAGAVRDLH